MKLSFVIQVVSSLYFLKHPIVLWLFVSCQQEYFERLLKFMTRYCTYNCFLVIINKCNNYLNNSGPSIVLVVEDDSGRDLTEELKDLVGPTEVTHCKKCGVVFTCGVCDNHTKPFNTVGVDITPCICAWISHSFACTFHTLTSEVLAWTTFHVIMISLESNTAICYN